jgi:hypothetical protein
MIDIHITEHAIDRYCERVENVAREVVRARMLAASRGILCAAAFGARCVILGNGVRLVIVADADGVRVVTALARGQHLRVPIEVMRNNFEGSLPC